MLGIMLMTMGGYEWATAAPPKPRRLDQYQQAKAKARRLDVPLVVTVGAGNFRCPPCERMKLNLRSWPRRSDVAWVFIDSNHWAVKSLRPRVTSYPTTYIWVNTWKSGNYIKGEQSSASLLSMVKSLQGKVVPMVTTSSTDYREYYRQKYGWIPDRHCGNRNCGMCNEIFGATYRRTSKYTPVDLLPKIAKLLDVKPNETFVDIGCGDGRVIAEVAKASPKSSLVGLEMDKDAAKLAKWHNPKASIVVADATKTPVVGDVVYMWLFPKTMKEIDLPGKARRIVSYMHPIPQLATRRVDVSLGGELFPFYVWSALDETRP